MSIALITGSGGLIGSECVQFFSDKGLTCIGIDNNLRKHFFGDAASTEWNVERLKINIPSYQHFNLDIRQTEEIKNLFSKFGKDISVIIHTAAQPSHDWAARDPFMDFSVNANGTLALLEAARIYCPDSVFIFTSTNKVYGDTPNFLPLEEKETRWEINSSHRYFERGIDESMSIDHTTHSLFGASKVAADVPVQEYGRYFGMKTAVFRGGCLTGPHHSGAQLHGFLSYLVKCAVTNTPYSVFGYKGKQVRDNIHSYDLVNMFWHFFNTPKSGVVYNAGGSRHSNCSVLEAIQICETLTGQQMNYQICDSARKGDHIWWVSDVQKFKNDFPQWNYRYSLKDIISQIIEHFKANL